MYDGYRDRGTRGPDQSDEKDFDPNCGKNRIK
jgi:hypothetical protein